MRKIPRCEDCDTDFDSDEAYTRHASRPRELFTCAHCPLVFGHYCIFEMHNQVDHPDLIGNEPQELPPFPRDQPLGNRRPDFSRLPSSRTSVPGLIRRRALLDRIQRSPLFSGQRQLEGQQPQHQHNEPQQQQSGTLPPSSSSNELSQIEGNLIDLDLDPPEEDDFERLQRAIANFYRVVENRAASRRDREVTDGQTEPQTEPEQEQYQEPESEQESEPEPEPEPDPESEPELEPEPVPNMPHATRDVEDDSDLPNLTPITIYGNHRRSLQPPLPAVIYCIECNANFGSLVALQQHQMVLNHNYCRLCFSFFANRACVRQHFDAVHRFRCIECPETFYTTAERMIHQRREDHAYCSLCEAFFTDVESKRIHDEMLHVYSVCPECDETFEKAAELKEHQKVTSHCYCRQCDEAFDSEEHLAGHIVLRHPHKCTAPNCTFSSPRLEALRNHERNHHRNGGDNDENAKIERNGTGA